MKSTANWTDHMLIDVGQALHKGRKVESILEEDAPKDATYDDRIGITYEPVDIESDGFRFVATPRRIGTTEVAEYAKPSCNRCHGVGKSKITKTASIGDDNLGRKIMQPVEYERTCPCAEKVYQAKNKNFLIDSQFDEWIALDGLEITKAFSVQVEGVDDGNVPEVPAQQADDKLPRQQSVP